MINRGVKAEDQNCAIKESGMVPVDKPIIFGGGRKYEKDYTFKQVIGHIIPGAFAVAALAPSFMHGSMGSMALPL